MICPCCQEQGKKVEMKVVYSTENPCQICPECGYEEGHGCMV